VTGTRRPLEAPHRRLEQGSRLVEKVGVWAYRTVSWVIARAPERPARAVIGLGAQLSYLLWPAKRRWSNANFGHVLGLPPNDPRVRKLALAAYREYARYLVELMRLPRLSPEQAGALVPSADLDAIEPIWQRARGGIIFALGHVGNNEAVAAGVAWRGWPISVVADDTAFPELYEDFRRMREAWGIRLIPWRNLREIYGVLRRREMLGLLVDWGYRGDGIPVRLFDAWTTLPAGPATLAAKTGSIIVPIVIRRAGEGHFHAEYRTPIEVASAEPADLARATQALADALAETIAAAPEQWYSFKPIWPETAAESAALERRALEALAGSL
jgi:KDO2-lipid IV(A) lauroyltransferase